jgi:hypothetical protein
MSLAGDKNGTSEKRKLCEVSWSLVIKDKEEA